MTNSSSIPEQVSSHLAVGGVYSGTPDPVCFRTLASLKSCPFLPGLGIVQEGEPVGPLSWW